MHVHPRAAYVWTSANYWVTWLARANLEWFECDHASSFTSAGQGIATCLDICFRSVGLKLRWYMYKAWQGGGCQLESLRFIVASRLAPVLWHDLILQFIVSKLHALSTVMGRGDVHVLGHKPSVFELRALWHALDWMWAFVPQDAACRAGVIISKWHCQCVYVQTICKLIVIRDWPPECCVAGKSNVWHHCYMLCNLHGMAFE